MICQGCGKRNFNIYTETLQFYDESADLYVEVEVKVEYCPDCYKIHVYDSGPAAQFTRDQIVDQILRNMESL